MRQTIVRLSLLVFFSSICSAGCRSTFRAGINHHDASTGGAEAGAEVGPDLGVADEPARVTDSLGDHDPDVGPAAGDSKPGADAGKDVENEVGGQIKAARLELVAGALGGIGSADGIGTDARFHWPGGITNDGAGNLFVTDTANCTIRKVVIATAAVTTIAGSPSSSGHLYGYGDGTAAARFDGPTSIASDGAGNLFVSDACAIRKIVLATGVVTTLAGSLGACGSSMDGSGADARFAGSTSLVSDGAGNLFVTDNYAIRKIVIATATVTTVAGSAGNSGSADGIGKDAWFKNPAEMALDSSGDLFVTDDENYTIRKVIIATGEVTTLAGSPGQPGNLDGAGDAARFYRPYGLTYDGAGNLFVTDVWNRTIRKVVIATGEVTTLAVGLSYPTSVAYDGAGNLFVADEDYTIRKVVIATGEVTTFAGARPYQGATAGTGYTHLNWPVGIASDGAGNLFVADSEAWAVRKVSIATGEVTTLAGGWLGYADGIGTAATFHEPWGLSCDGTGNLLVSDHFANRIRRIVVATAEVTTLAGSPSGSFGNADGLGSAAQFGYPSGVASDGAGNLFVGDNSGIRKVVIATGDVTTIPGIPNDASGLAWDGAGNLFAVGNGTVRRVVAATGETTTLAGSPGVRGSIDGTGSDARFAGPSDVAFDGKGNLFVVDGFTVRKVVIATGAVTTVVGRPNQRGVIPGPLPASLNFPGGIAVGPSGELFITDSAESAVLVVRF